jgi:uncharacterized SAM-binding protein YcdF (DUF218 family)
VTAFVTWAKETLRLSSTPFIVLMLLAGAALLLVRPRWGRRWVIAFAAAFWFCSTPLGSEFLARPLARGFHPIEQRSEAHGVDAIVVLGGGTFDATAGGVHLGYPTAATAQRLVEAVRLHRLLGGEPLIVASGGIPPGGQGPPEAEVIAAQLSHLQVPPDHIVLDPVSRTTREQAVAVTRLLRARGINRFALVTSPPHMWRAVLAFRAEGADVVPSAYRLGSSSLTDRRTFMPSGASLRLSDDVLYGYASAAYYWARGWFRPAPSVSTT